MTARVPPARIDLRRAKSRPRGTDLARAVPRTDTGTILDGGTATPVTRTRVRLNGTSLLDLTKFTSNIVYTYTYIVYNNNNKHDI